MNGKKKECGHQTEVYSRVVGYYRPVQNWNKGKKEEFKGRKTFKLDDQAVAEPRPVVCATCETREQPAAATA